VAVATLDPGAFALARQRLAAAGDRLLRLSQGLAATG
jgi:hypothetical protein